MIRRLLELMRFPGISEYVEIGLCIVASTIVIFFVSRAVDSLNLLHGASGAKAS